MGVNCKWISIKCNQMMIVCLKVCFGKSPYIWYQMFVCVNQNIILNSSIHYTFQTVP